MKRFLIIFILVPLLGFSQQDKSGSIVHIVKTGETLFALSREYNVSVEEIKKANPGMVESLYIDQKVLIPRIAKAKLPPGEIHTVAAGETLFSVSKKYNVPVAEIKKMNNLEDDGLSVGQQIVISKAAESNPDKTVHIVKAGETLYSISRLYGVIAYDLMKANGLQSVQLSIDQKLNIPLNTAKTTNGLEITLKPDSSSIESTDEVPGEVSQKEVIKEEAKEEIKEEVKAPDPEQTDLKPMETDEFVETTEKGVAELIPDTEDTRKYLALHRSIPVNTIIRVRNEINGKEIWARVVGKLPDTGENKDVLIKISKAAYSKLGALDKKFRVVITYIP